MLSERQRTWLYPPIRTPPPTLLPPPPKPLVTQSPLSTDLPPLKNSIHPYLLSSPFLFTALRSSIRDGGSYRPLNPLHHAYFSTSQPPEPPSKFPLRGWPAIRARPFLHIFSFATLHLTLAWALIPPIYTFFRSTGSANALLAGPQVAWILNRPVPDWFPLAMRIKRQGADGSVDGFDDDHDGKLTVEDLIEVMARNFAGKAWKASVGAYGQAKGLGELARGGMSLFKKKAEVEDGKRAQEQEEVELERVEKTLTRSAMDLLRGVREKRRKGKEGTPVADGSEEGSTTESGEAEIRAIEEEMVTRKERKGWISKSLGSTVGKSALRNAQEIKLTQVRDAIAAYVVVKTLFPLRLPVSLLLTPRFARLLTRIFSRS
ncbi:hypothetical protein IE53DRAFT_387951 [Violaceomyces palustris]|uniref:Uncharacterized protein n=1 Tax=Violaceomyces palustris TaxID=1673888 RepID=A0ACD0NVJ6_9BASI|nr:hypothetical protein IE53DRAFT_387951 [Violaceomyces palustris]